MVSKFGLCGVGGRDKTVFYDMKRLDWLKLDAVCDTDKTRLDNRAMELEVRNKFPSYEDMLATDIDFVYLSTPPATHAEMSIQALEAGKPVLCEVPAVMDVDEARRLREAIEKTGLLYMLAENYCYRRDIQAFKRFIEQGQLGKIVYAHGNYCHDDRWIRHGWWLEYEMPRYITHSIGPILYATNDKVTHISALAYEGQMQLNNKKQPQFVSAQCQTRSGAVFSQFYGMGVERMDISYCFTGETGTVESYSLPVSGLESNPPILGDKPYRLTRMQPDVAADLRHGRMIDLDPGETFNSYRGGEHWESDLCVVAVFARCLREAKPSPIGLELALDMTLPGISAIESIKKGGVPIEVATL